MLNPEVSVNHFKQGATSALLVLLSAFFIPLAAGEPPADPMLQIETGMHTASIRELSAEQSGKRVLSVSWDKTARIWDLESGRLLNTLRIPIGPGYEGRINTGAFSPDGRMVALGGYTGRSWNDGKASIYIMDPVNGQMMKTLSGLPCSVATLAFSPDGRYLAASLIEANGIRVWDLQSKTPPMSDTNYGDRSFLAWSNANQIVSTCYDGKLRLHSIVNGKLEKITERQTNNRPEGIAFSPDGQSIAIGSMQPNRVDIYNTPKLTLKQTLTIPADRVLTNVCWSKDGQTIYAAGSYAIVKNNEWWYAIRRWEGPSFTKYTDLPTAIGCINNLKITANGKVLVATDDPSWGLLTTVGKWEQKQSSPGINDSFLQPADFLVSSDGRSFQSNILGNKEMPWSFSLEKRSLVKQALPGVQAADNSSLPVTNWQWNEHPKIRGKELSLDKLENALSLAITPDKKTFILGTTWNLRLYDANGQLSWEKTTQGNLAVNIPAAGKTVLAVTADGTIRWYRLSDGQELLAFFSHADQKRWVLWTPSGYYDCSPGGEDLIAWHLNRGADQSADFFPASRFRDRFYRPDVIDRILDTLDEKEAVRLADEARGIRAQTAVAITNALPPIIELAGADDVTATQATLNVGFRLRSPADAPVTAVRYRIDGQASEQKGLSVVATGNAGQNLTVTLPPRDCVVQLFAENKNGISVPATVRVTWKGAKVEFTIKPKLYVLAVGVGAYANKDIPQLNLAAKDARDFSAALQAQSGKMYREVEVKLLTDKDATRDDVVDGLDWLQKQVTQHDVGMLFLSGHGLNDPTMGYVYLPVNADPEKLKRTGVAMNDIRDTMASLTGKSVFFLDTCHSGNVLGPARKAVGNDINAVVNELSSAENGVVVFSSSTGRQYSLESPEWGNGAFTKALIEGLKGQADYQGTGRITFKMLDLYVSERVKKLTGGQQSPVTQAPGGVPDFPLAVK
jgi:WD40 repeat protein